jgi:hypothetical protein
MASPGKTIEERRAYDRAAYQRRRPAAIAYSLKYQLDHPEETKINNRRQRLKKYGLSIAQYEALERAQGSTCAICGARSPGRRDKYWHVDHDHKTGKVRGLLCSRCNIGLGNLHDDPSILLAALAYLKGRLTPAC